MMTDDPLDIRNSSVTPAGPPPPQRWFRIVFWLVILTSGGILSWLMADVQGRLDGLRTTQIDNAQWTTLQLQSELLKLENAAVALSNAQPGAGEDFKFRLELVDSRIELFKTAELYAEAREQAFFQDGLAKLSKFRNKLGGYQNSGGNMLAADSASMLQTVRDSQKASQLLVIDTVSFFSRQSSVERKSLFNVLVAAAVLLMVMVAALVSAIAFLRRQTNQLERREAMLVESKQQLSATTRSALDAVVVTDADGNIIDWNDSAVTCFGFTREEVMGTDMATLIFPAEQRQIHRQRLQMLRECGSPKLLGQRTELIALNADGEEFPVELAVGISRNLKQPVFVSYLRDISDRKRAELDLTRALQKAKSANSAKARFLAVMSHEMRTPLNGVIGTLDLLERTDLNPDQELLVTTALNSGEALLAQITDVLDFSKLEAGKLAFDLAPVSPNELLSKVRSVLTSQARERGNTIHVDIDSAVPSWISGDYMRLRQVLLNFASNAVKFTSRGEVRMDARVVGLVDDKFTIRFAVTDSGIGIASESIPLLFREFSMVDDSYRRQSGGTGLGLAICKGIVEAMDGQIGVNSQVGRGSTFWFTATFASVAAPLVECIAVSDQPAEVAQKKLRILLAEDNLTNQMVATRMLKGMGHDVVAVADGAAAVDSAMAGGYDMVFMDISMPVMDGIEATRAIRVFNKCIPIIAMTANAVAGDRERFLDTGMNGYLSKPIRQIDLAAAMKIAFEPSNNVETEMAEHIILDRAELARLADDAGADFVPIVINQFLAEISTRLVQLDAAELNTDIVLLQKTAHAMSGLCATVGAKLLQEKASEVERLCIDKAQDQAFSKVRAIKSAALHTQDAYTAELAA